MSASQQRLWVVGADEVDGQRGRVSHLISIANPGAGSAKPAWFRGAHLQLWFGDVSSEADAAAYRTKAATTEDVRNALEFFRAAWHVAGSKILIHCTYGASRSPALAYVCVADQLGGGQEGKALGWIVSLRPQAVPNRWVVQLGDALLGRSGALLVPLRELYRRIDGDLARFRTVGPRQ